MKIVNYLWNGIFHDYHVILYITLLGPSATYQVSLFSVHPSLFFAFLTNYFYQLLIIENLMLSNRISRFFQGSNR